MTMHIADMVIIHSAPGVIISTKYYFLLYVLCRMQCMSTYAETPKAGHSAMCLQFCNVASVRWYSTMINMFVWYVRACVYSDVSKGLPQNLNLATNIDFSMAVTDVLFYLLRKEEY